MKRKLRQYEIYKISTDRFVETKGETIKVVPLTLTKREALENGEVVKIQQNQLIDKLFDYFYTNNLPGANRIIDLIVNVVVPVESKKQGEREYELLAKNGLVLNGNTYVRLFSGSGQIRRNTITFIRQDLYEPIISSLMCGLTFDDFGSDFNSAKFNAYAGLNMSGCHLLPEALAPRVCVVDDYEEIRPAYPVNYVTERQVEYITLPEKDLVLTDDQTDFKIDGKTAIRKSDNVPFTIRGGNQKQIHEVSYSEIEDSPALNSFDGQGLMSPTWSQAIADYLGLGYIPSEVIIRAPWIKGLLVTVPFHQFFESKGISQIVDLFGQVHNLQEVDILLSKSQFKMWKIYKEKCEDLDVSVWDYYLDSMAQNHLKWGIVKANNKSDDSEKLVNYQYLQALDLTNDQTEKLCEKTENFLQKLNSGDIEEIYKNLIVNAKNENDEEYQSDSSCDDYKKLFQKVIECNNELINDRYIRSQILKECSAKMTGAKLGKLLVRGNYQFCASDPVAQMEWIARRHCDCDCDVVGVIPVGHIYSNYWRTAQDKTDEVVLMRSPLIDRNEIAKRQLMEQEQAYFRYLTSGLIYSIHDLTALQQGGCDFDGDIIFSTNDETIANGCLDFQTARPLYYELGSTGLTGSVSDANLISADIRGLNSRVGSISNKACSLYAMLKDKPKESAEYKLIYDGIIVLGQIVGQEIDRIKTGIYPTMPYTWSSLQVTYIQKSDFTTEENISEQEKEGIYRHNDFVPDIKPYYFRYNYPYIDKSIRQLESAFNKVCKWTYGLKFPELMEQYKADCDSLNDDKIQFVKQYLRAYPVNDNDCIVNHICHFFERVENNLQKQVTSEGENMLLDFVDKSKILDSRKLSKVEEYIYSYQRFKRFETKRRNCIINQGVQEIRKTANNVITMMRLYYHDAILDLFDGDIDTAFNYVMSVSPTENLVWELLDTDILTVIKKGSNEK